MFNPYSFYENELLKHTLEYELLNDTGYRMPLTDYHMVHKYKLLKLSFDINAEKRISE